MHETKAKIRQPLSAAFLDIFALPKCYTAHTGTYRDCRNVGTLRSRQEPPRRKPAIAQGSTYQRNEGIESHSLTSAQKGREWLTTPTALHPKKEPGFPLEYEATGSQSQFGRFRYKANRQALPEFQTRTPYSP
jgi:hypothetical protein